MDTLFIPTTAFASKRSFAMAADGNSMKYVSLQRNSDERQKRAHNASTT